MLRYITLFIHISAALGVFTALGVELLALTQLRQAEGGAEARKALTGFRSSQRLAGPAMLLLLLTGLRLASAYWHWQGAWMPLGLAGMVTAGLIGGVLTGRRVRRLSRSLGDDGPGRPWSDDLAVLRTSFMMRAALLLGVVFLMTVKPG